MLLLDEFAYLLDGARRRVAVVEADQIDLAAVDAALIVDHFHIGLFGFPNGAVCRRRAAVGHGLADFYFFIGGAGVVFVLRAGGAGKRQADETGERRE